MVNNTPRDPAGSRGRLAAPEAAQCPHVATALTQAGRPVHFTAVNRWRSQGWRAGPSEHPVAQARAVLDSAIPILTGEPTSTAGEFLLKNSDSEDLRRRRLHVPLAHGTGG